MFPSSFRDKKQKSDEKGSTDYTDAVHTCVSSLVEPSIGRRRITGMPRLVLKDENRGLLLDSVRETCA